MSDTDTAATGEEGFLSRWSRRKHEDRAQTIEEAPEAADEQEVLAEEQEQSERLPTDEDMPPVETLDEHSDYAGFMSPEVSDELRKLALRKLFSSQMFNVRDGLDDYDDDFTSFAKLGDIVTSDMRYQMERMSEAMADGEEQGQEASQQAEAGEPGEPVEDLASEEDTDQQTESVVDDGEDEVTTQDRAGTHKEDTDGHINDR